MAIVNRQEFAVLCGKSDGYISTNIIRKKIATHGFKDKLIDTENPLNKIFVKNCKQLNKGTKPKAVKPTPKPKPVPSGKANPKELEDVYNDVVEKIYSHVETPEEKFKREQKNEEDEDKLNDYNDWDLRKKVADALKAEALAEKERLNVEKLMGQLIPIDLYKMIFKVNIQDILQSFTSEMTNLASIYCDILAGGDRDKLAELTSKMQVALNTIIKRVEITAAKEVENVIEDYAETRSRGEKK